MGRLLFKMFGGSNPAVRALNLEDEHDQIPGDLIECWATCYWCPQACLAAPLLAAERTRIERYIRPLAERAYSLTLSTPDELLGDTVITIMSGMNEQYAERLGIDRTTITAGHKTLTTALFAQKQLA